MSEHYPQTRFCIGLTGGIGCGKSSVTDQFRALGVDVIDADEVARQLVAPGMPALESIRGQFGDQYILDDGTLNRAKLRELIFSDSGAKGTLEALLHPLIRDSLREQAEAALAPPYTILSIPLLLELQWTDLIDALLVIDCSVEQQITRTMARDGCSEEVVRAIIASQAERQIRLAAADYLIDNSTDTETLQRAVVQMHQMLLHATDQLPQKDTTP